MAGLCFTFRARAPYTLCTGRHFKRAQSLYTELLPHSVIEHFKNRVLSPGLFFTICHNLFFPQNGVAKKVLQELFPKLKKCLPGKELGGYLYAKDILMEIEWQTLSTQPLNEQNEVMIKALQRGPDNALDILIESLNDIGSYSHITDEIRCKQKEISSKFSSCEYIFYNVCDILCTTNQK